MRERFPALLLLQATDEVHHLTKRHVTYVLIRLHDDDVKQSVEASSRLLVLATARRRHYHVQDVSNGAHARFSVIAADDAHQLLHVDTQSAVIVAMVWIQWHVQCGEVHSTRPVAHALINLIGGDDVEDESQRLVTIALVFDVARGAHDQRHRVLQPLASVVHHVHNHVREYLAHGLVIFDVADELKDLVESGVTHRLRVLHQDGRHQRVKHAASHVFIRLHQLVSVVQHGADDVVSARLVHGYCSHQRLSFFTHVVIHVLQRVKHHLQPVQPLPLAGVLRDDVQDEAERFIALGAVFDHVHGVHHKEQHCLALHGVAAQDELKHVLQDDPLVFIIFYHAYEL